MKILVACEESQAVTKAFRKNGHEAYSCDVLKCSGGNPEWHLHEDVLPLLLETWDMIVAFPPCTHLASSGARWFRQKQEDGRQPKAIDFFLRIANADCDKICIENPIGIMSTEFRKPNQIINPWQFGHPVKKATCLWLKNLPPLKPTNIVEKGDDITLSSGKVMSKWYYETSCLPQKDRATARSKTFQGIADAMADQWS